MKTLYKFLALIFIASLTSCDKEIELIESFNFEIEENHNLNSTIKIEELTSFSIVPDQIVTTNKYYFKYNVDQGEGYYIDQNDNRIPIGEWVELSDLDFKFSYVGEEIGEHLILIDIKDSKELTKPTEIKYNIEHSSFTVSLNSIREKVTINKPTNISLALINDGEDKSATFKYKFSFLEGNGEINELNDKGEIERSITPNQSYDIEEGALNYEFKSTEKGSTKLIAEVINNNGKKQKDTLNFNAEDRTFDFTATRGLAEINLGESVNITYTIEENGGLEKDSYEMTYTNSSNGSLSINGVTYKAGEVIRVPDLSFVAIYTPLKDGNHRIESTITALSNKKPITKETEVRILPSEFTFDVTSATELTVNDVITVDFNLNETVGNSDFDIKYSVTGVNQEFKNISGTILQKDRDYDVSNNTFSWTLKAIAQGEMTVTYTVTNQFGVSEPKTVVYTINPIDFNFTSRPEGTKFITEEAIPFVFDMTAPSTLTYQMSFESSGDAIVNYNGTDYAEGEQFDVPSSGFNLNLFSETGGSNTIIWTITASNGVSKPQTNTININQKPTITGVRFGVSGSVECGVDGLGRPINGSRLFIALDFNKAPDSRIVNVNVIYSNTRNTGQEEVNSDTTVILNNNNTSLSYTEIGCMRLPQNINAIITITDDKGFKSNQYTITNGTINRL